VLVKNALICVTLRESEQVPVNDNHYI
jgi:hypothetical protein